MAPNHIKFKGSNFFFFLKKKIKGQQYSQFNNSGGKPTHQKPCRQNFFFTSIRTSLTLSITCFICRENVGNQETQLKKLKLDSLSLF